MDVSQLRQLLGVQSATEGGVMAREYKTVRGKLVGFEEVSRKSNLVRITLLVELRQEFDLTTGAEYLVAFDRPYARPPILSESSALATESTAP